MTPLELADRGLFKFTGPPENWLTAIKYMTWGLEEKHLERWKRIEPGDIFLMHSTSTNSRIKNVRSSVIGFGVVSAEFRRKGSPLWLQEIEQHKNIWPLLVPFSEIYLFSELPFHESLQAPDGKNDAVIAEETRALLNDAVSLPIGFPQMGSISAVKPEITVQVLGQAQRFYLYNSVEARESYVAPKELKPVESPHDLIRKPVTLEQMQDIKKKTIQVGSVTYAKDLQTLERAESAHHETLSSLLELLKSRGYETFYNRHVDLFAHRGQRSFLFEVKSLSQKNFRAQSRKGIVQLFEYEYFEIRKYMEDNHLESSVNKALIYSQEPEDTNYIDFINNLKMSAGYFIDNTLETSGQGSILTTLA